MNKEIKARWIKALLSGEYKQGKGFLRNPEGEYCCLGVLCDLYSKETGVEWGEGRGGINTMHGDHTMTPIEVESWAGSHQRHSIYGTLLHLADLNDSGKAFEEIVEVIKEKL